MGTILQQVQNLIANRPLEYSPGFYLSSSSFDTTTAFPTRNGFSNSFASWLKSCCQFILSKRLGSIVLLSSAIFYIIYPSLPPFFSFNKQPPASRKMFTKRPDKYTTGLINMRNDCFANSSIQAYLSLPGLTEYLNRFVLAFNDFNKYLKDHDFDIDTLNFKHQTSNGNTTNSSSTNVSTTNSENERVNPKFKKIELSFTIPLHVSLAKIIKKLQSTQMTTRTISVWTFLHDLEKIFNAKISRSQHDAHELTQLINETLENENLKIHKKYNALMKKLTSEDPSLNPMNPKLINDLRLIEFPEFPLNGLILTQMKCLNCKGVSKPRFLQFLMLTLHTPETTSTDLETLLNENESESIDYYQCLSCRIKYIINNENYLKKQKENYELSLSAEESKILNTLYELDGDQNFCINDDLPEDTELYIKSYDKNGADISKVTSTVLRKNQILKPPKIFGLHLSRSSFNGFNVVRNSCRVSFRDHLKLSIGKEYHEDLKQFQAAAQDYEDNSLNTKHLEAKVLTTDVNDMEDEFVQREDIEDTIDNASDHDNDRNDVSGSGNEDDLYSDSDASSISNQTLRNRNSSSKTSTSSSSNVKTPESLNNAPISTDQTDDLLNHFKKFKFNENDTYKYRLKAMIRHQGSHTQGHYECYKRKPLYVKDKDGIIIKLSPEILDEVVADNKANEPPKDATTKYRRESVVSSSSDNKDTDDAGASNGTTNNTSSSGDRPDIMASLNEENIPEPPGAFRRKFSNMMGRRPSIYQANPEDVEIQEIIPSGLNTPAEFSVKDLDANYFDQGMAQQVNSKLDQSQNDIKLKKIPSMLKNPYWRISDSVVTEVTKAAVLCETTSVYMLYYERVEK